jgi:hypothetical protein
MPKQTTAKKKTPTSKRAPRVLQLPKRVWYNPLSWRFTPPAPDYKPLPKARHIFATTVRQLWTNKRLFGGIILIYGVLNLALVRSLAGSENLNLIKNIVDDAIHGVGGKVLSSLAGFGYLLATSGSAKAQVSTTYQYMLLLFCSLAYIWALRQVLAKNVPRIRDSFYHGMYPLVPFLLVFVMLCVQLLPLVGGGTLFNMAIGAGIATSWLEKFGFFVVFALLAYWSLRMITSTLFALYIVTLPNMAPMQAIRSAKKLVYGRRLLIWRKLIFLPLCLLLFALIAEVPLILLLTPLAPWMFFVLSMIALPIVHGYLYNVYRDML